MKGVIFSGGTAEMRKAAIEALTKGQRAYRLKEHLANYDKYITNVRQSFPVTSPTKGVTKNQMNFDQIADYYLEWVKDQKDVILVWPEATKMYQRDVTHFYRIVSDFLTLLFTCPDVRIYISLEHAIPDLADHVEMYIGQDPAKAESVPELFRKHFRQGVLV